MAINYRKDLVDLALSFVGSTTPQDDELFLEAHRERVEEKTTGPVEPSVIFCNYVCRMAGIPIAVIPNFTTTADAIARFGIQGLYHEASSGYAPKAGDFMIFERPNSSDWISIVVGCGGAKIDTIEAGRSSSGVYSVWRKSIAGSSAFIKGYLSPDYECKQAHGLLLPYQLSSLVKASWTKCFQRWLGSNYNEARGINPTGHLSQAWRTAIVSCWQVQLNTDKKTGLDITGEFDDASLIAADRRVLKVHSSGNMVRILQGLLYVNGYDPHGFDGKFGSATAEAVRAFQRSRKLEDVDGIVGVDTWESLLAKR